MDELQDIATTTPPAEAPGREPVSITEREKPSLKSTLRAAWDEHQGKESKDGEKEPSAARSEAAKARDRREDGKFAPTDKSTPKPDRGALVSSPSTKQDSAPKDAAATTAKPTQSALDRPSAWGADKATLWSALPPEAQEFLAKREADISKGFAEYGAKVKNYDEIDKVMARLRPVLQQHGQSDAEGIAKMIGWQEALGGPHRADAFRALAKATGFDLSTLAQPSQGQTPANAQADPLKPYLEPVVSQINEFGRKLTAFEQAQQQERLNRANAELATFAKDKPYFDRVRVQMAHLMTVGLATSIEDAYNKATRVDPDVWAEMQKAEQDKRDADAKAAQETERQKQAAAEEERRKRDAEAVAKARKASVSPRGSTPAPGSSSAQSQRLGRPAAGKTVRDTLVQTLRESRA